MRQKNFIQANVVFCIIHYKHGVVGAVCIWQFGCFCFMLERGENYSIFRVYNAGGDHNDARIEEIENPSSLLQQGKILPNPITLQL